MTLRPLSDDTFVTVLLCSGLGGKSNAASPLSRTEWNLLVRSLVRANWRPGDLLRWGIDAARHDLGLADDMASRLSHLLSQSVRIASEVERLATSGIGVLSRADEAYPARWRSRLREQSPPLLFVTGPVGLLERGGIAVVGSRNVDPAGADFARHVGSAAARSRTPVISGGARGVDREAMFGALEAGGEAIGILPDSLARTLRAPEVRRWMAEGQLVLASPQRPDAGFHVGNAMGRNKLIYTLADAAVVISSDVERGGTWAGATENLRHDWSPLFVRAGDDAPTGNRRLLDLGAMPLHQADLDAGRDGDLLHALLARADRASRAGTSAPIQRPLLDHGDDEREVVRDGRHLSATEVQGTLPTPAGDPGQLKLL